MWRPGLELGPKREPVGGFLAPCSAQDTVGPAEGLPKQR